MTLAAPDLETRIAAVRRFSRFYTRQLGLLQENLMHTVESLLGASSQSSPAVLAIILRQHQPGDMGWVTSAHGALYASEYGWDITFEALVAKITAEFIENFDSKHERCWIAELDGER